MIMLEKVLAVGMISLVATICVAGVAYVGYVIVAIKYGHRGMDD